MYIKTDTKGSKTYKNGSFLGREQNQRGAAGSFQVYSALPAVHAWLPLQNRTLIGQEFLPFLVPLSKPITRTSLSSQCPALGIRQLPHSNSPGSESAISGPQTPWEAANNEAGLPNPKTHRRALNSPMETPPNFEVPNSHPLTCTSNFSPQTLLTKTPHPKQSPFYDSLLLSESLGK